MNAWNPISTVKNAARNSPWIVMAVALHLILIAVAMVYYTTSASEEVLDNRFVVEPSRPRPIEEIIVPVEPPPRNAIPVNKDAELVEVPQYVPDMVLPVSETPIGDPDASDDFAPSLAQSSTAIGVGFKGTAGPRVTPFTNRNPFPPGKGVKDGGRLNDQLPEPEKSVLGGLRWLARHQNADGSWGATALEERCDGDHKCDDPKQARLKTYDEGLTSLALLAYLGAGFSHESKPWFKDPARADKKVVTGEVVRRGLMWLVEHQNADGSFGSDRPFMYNQALATMALAEAYGLTQHRYWREPAQRAVDYLAGAQRPDPHGKGLWGWRYASRQDVERMHMGDSLDQGFQKELYDADTSVTGWAVMALKSAKMAGLDVPDAHLQGALTFAKWVSVADGLAGYIDAKSAGGKITGPDDHFDYHTAGMSALSMCIRTFAAHDLDDPFLEPAAKRLVADLPRVSKDRLSIDYYYWYYGSLALFQFDGPDSPRARGNHWKAWNKAMLAAVIELQAKGRDCGEGGWLVPDRWCHSGGPIYATAINVLTLEVYYRYENAFSIGRARKTDPNPPVEGVRK